MPTRYSIFVLLTITASVLAAQSFRPPAVPLVTHNPYFSLWSMDDTLTDGPTRHWTGTPQPLTGFIRIDGETYRWMGKTPDSIPAIKQNSVEVTPTHTIYHFGERGIKLTVTFLSPLLPSDLDVLSRPVSYVSFSSSSTDGHKHDVQILFQVSGELAINSQTDDVVWSRSQLNGITVLRASHFEQPILQKSGDNLRIDWGSVLLAVPDQKGGTTSTQMSDVLFSSFSSGKPLPTDNIDMPQRGDQAALLAAMFDFHEVSTANVSRHVLLAYDDIYSVEYFHRWLRPYWRRNGMDIGGLLETAEREYSDLEERTRRFDDKLLADLQEVGGPGYAELATLAYRQAIAAHELAVDIGGEPMFFPKENFSNGCISTVDVIYPSAPLFLLLNPKLLRAQLRPLMEYAQSSRWRFPFAPHDLGTYPKANGQVYGGGERSADDQMPVEESGNMLLLFAALAKVEGKTDFADQYWLELRKWAEYLEREGMDPPNQLSTDDFTGHLAHNANLSLKAILALDAYAALADKTGHASESTKYHTLARNMAKNWTAQAADGDHFRLAFDQPGSWSQKYNLVWDRVLNLNVFSPNIARTEYRFYMAHMNAFGLPLDSRSLHTKLDWEMWTATLAENRKDFAILMRPIEEFINRSASRVPLTDWYSTTDGKQIGFQARSVVGGVYMPLLANEAVRRKWLSMPAWKSSPTSCSSEQLTGHPLSQAPCGRFAR